MTENHHSSVGVNGEGIKKPRLQKRSRHYEKLNDLQKQLDKIVQDELSKKSTPHNMIPHQCFVYAVVSKIEQSYRPNCYRIRIDDETLSDVLCRIEVDPSNPKVGPKMSIGDIIRIHRLTVQMEYDDENRTRNMVLSTCPHHNYTLFKCYDTGALGKMTCAEKISFTQSDEDRVRAIGRWGRIKFRVAMIETHRVRKTEVKENIPVQNNIESNCLGVESEKSARSNPLENEPQVISQSNRLENEPQVISLSNRLENEPQVISQSNRLENEPQVISQSNRLENEPQVISQSNRVENQPEAISQLLALENEPEVISQESRLENEPQGISHSESNCLGAKQQAIPDSNTFENEMTASSLSNRQQAGQVQTITVCKENEANSMSVQQHSGDAQNSGTSVSTQKDQSGGMSNIKKMRRVKALPEKVASFLNSQMKQPAISLSDNSFNKNQMETFNRGRELKESHSSKNVRTEKDTPFPQTTILPGSDSDLFNEGKQQQQRKAAIDIEQAPATNQFSLLDTPNNYQTQSDVAPSVLFPGIPSISNVNENEQEMENAIPASLPVKTYSFMCAIKDFQPCFDFKDEELRFWLRIQPLMDETPAIETVRCSLVPEEGESTIDILVNKVNTLSETELKTAVEGYVSSGSYVLIQDVILKEGEVGCLPTYTIDAPDLLEQIPNSQNMVSDVGSLSPSGANQNEDIVEKEMDVSSSLEKELNEVPSNNSSFHTALSNSSNTSLQSFTSFANSLDNQSEDLTILDVEQTIVIPKYSNTSAGGDRDQTSNMESNLSRNSSVHGIEEVELTNNSPQSFNVANANDSTFIEEEETDAESSVSVCPADTTATNSQQSQSEIDESENDNLPKSSTESSDFEPTETYHSRPLPKRAKWNFEKLDVIKEVRH